MLLKSAILDDLVTDQEASCFSASLDSPTSSGASSCPTPTSASDRPSSQLSYTAVITESTPYACSFCKKTFPRFSFLKKHEQVILISEILTFLVTNALFLDAPRSNAFPLRILLKII